MRLGPLEVITSPPVRVRVTSLRPSLNQSVKLRAVTFTELATTVSENAMVSRPSFKSMTEKSKTLGGMVSTPKLSTCLGRGDGSSRRFPTVSLTSATEKFR